MRSVPTGSPLFDIQNDMFLCEVPVLGLTKFMDKLYSCTKTSAELEQKLHKQELAVQTVKNLFEEGFFNDCLKVEKQILDRAFLVGLTTHLKNTSRDSVDRRDCIRAQRQVGEYLKYLKQCESGSDIPSMTPWEEYQAEANRPFDPQSKLGQSIITGEQLLPMHQVVPFETRHCLSHHDQNHLSIFESISEAISIKKKSYSQLAALRIALDERKKPYQQHFDAQDWAFFGADETIRNAVLDSLMSQNVISTPKNWKVTSFCKRKLKFTHRNEKDFTDVIDMRHMKENYTSYLLLKRQTDEQERRQLAKIQMEQDTYNIVDSSVLVVPQVALEEDTRWLSTPSGSFDEEASMNLPRKRSRLDDMVTGTSLSAALSFEAPDPPPVLHRTHSSAAATPYEKFIALDGFPYLNKPALCSRPHRAAVSTDSSTAVTVLPTPSTPLVAVLHEIQSVVCQVDELKVKVNENKRRREDT